MEALFGEYGLVGACLIAGGAWGQSMFRLNLQGTKLQAVEDELGNHEKHVIDRLARIETKIDALSK